MQKSVNSGGRKQRKKKKRKKKGIVKHATERKNAL